MNTVAAVIVTFVLFVPVALYFFSVVGRERERPDPESEPQPQAEPEPTTMTVEQTWAPTTTNISLTQVEQTTIIGGSDGDRPAIDAPRPRLAPPDDGPEWTPPTNLDGLPDLSDYDVQVEVNRPAPGTTSPPETPPAAEAVAIERGLLDRVRDWLGDGGDTPPPAVEPFRPDPDWLDVTADPARLPEPRLPGLPAPDAPAVPEVHVEQLPDAATAGTGEPAALPPAAPPPAEPVTAEIEPVEVIEPIALQGVDDVDLVPTGRRTMARVPTPGGIQAAMRTIGYTILYTWLKAFRKANESDLGNAQRMHRMALGHAQRARVKLAIASNLLLAVQADRLGPHVIRNCQAAWLQAHREASAAYQVAIETGVLVRASGGVPLSIKAAMNALERDHGGMAAAARKMTVEPVRDMSWYRR
ncbi:hypothetical protein AB0J43_01335 [Nonomuraea fuscirosea]